MRQNNKKKNTFVAENARGSCNSNGWTGIWQQYRCDICKQRDE